MRERFEEALRAIYDLSIAIFPGNFAYAPVEWDEFRALYEGAGALVDPALVHLARDRAGRAVGFHFGLPDLAPALRAMRGESGPLAKLRFALARARARARPERTHTIVKTIGVLPEARGAQVGSALVHEHSREALARGHTRAYHALMYAGNLSSRCISEKSGRTIRTYALFERTL